MKTIRSVRALVVLAVAILAMSASSLAQLVSVDRDRSARTACVHATHGSGRRLLMDARLLGLWW